MKTSSDKVYSATKLVAALNVLDQLGADTDHVFDGMDLKRDDFDDPQAKISALQQIRMFKNISEAADDPMLPFQIGQSIHVSAYGLFGYAILCSKDYATAASFAQKYHDLAAPLIDMEFVCDAERTGWRIQPIPHPLVNDDFYVFLLNLHVGIYLTLHKDIFGPDFHPDFIDVTYSPQARFAIPTDVARIVHRAKENLLHIPQHHVENPLVLSNDHTHLQMEQICRNELDGLRKSSGLSGKVRGYFLRSPGTTFASVNLNEVAQHFHMASRTLRRRLQAEGATLSGIQDAVRSEVAVKYIRENQLTNEEVANVLGFSDPASFGRAFRRWTGHAPRAYRGIE